MFRHQYRHILLITLVFLAANTAQAQPRGTSTLTPLVKLDQQAQIPMMTGEMVPGDGAEKSRFLGVVLSSLLPGMGELYAGRFDRGIYPLVVEGVLWFGFAGFNFYGGWLQDDARQFAQQNAGAQVGGKNEQYFVDISNYKNTSEYNAAKLVQKNLAALYSEESGSAYLWNWSSDADRKKYRDQRTLSESMYNSGRFMVLGMVVNRIWSAIQASVSVRDYNKEHAGAAYLRRVEMQTRILSMNGRTDGVQFRFVAPL
jgi:TM2 domain-containing membrane protein YozV